MTTQELLDYIKQKKEEGINKEEIKKSLQNSGWEENDIEEGFRTIENSVRGEDIHYQPQETSKRPRLLIVSAVLGLLIIAGGVFGYFYYYAQSPEEVVKKMIEKTAELKSSQYEGEIAIETKDEGEALISFNGASDFRDSAKPKVKFGLDFEADTLPQSVGGEVRIIKDILYFKINNIPRLGFFDLSSLESQWIKADRKTVMPGKESEITSEEILGKELTEEQIEKINEIFILERKLPGDKINGVSVYRYEFSLNEEKIIEQAIEMGEKAGMPPTEEGLEEIREAFQKMKHKGELWIGKKDFLLYKITFSMDIQDEGSWSKISFVSRIKNHNEPVQIEVPSPVKTFEEIFGGFEQPFSGGLLFRMQKSWQV